ncbi:MAG: 1-(5-phosphoribosyl)-5-[(5-phosphoribosylamino)methylideneamino]imidazole-4-carboxamide isomerase [Clostridiaceae bacterium]|jgi:phosphoribosylformimino-5-aminoimidazole carboxamide ribotide isomerase|nr:1-(5-phosphoribosyl)-5-[(5-phosphoribosylamino)methylideneamino]imidazole-4-carboxamide isomerase [Clostridiaceae bacterium]
MKIFPAIDIKDGKAVRLTRGDYGLMKVYSESPESVLEGFKAAGADCLHVVDLDGAKDGELSNFDTVKKLVSAGGVFVEVGGGIRDIARIEKYLNAGAGRVILGTVAVKNYAFTEEAVSRFGAAVAVGVDASGGYVAVNGWKEVTAVKASEFLVRLKNSGVQTVIYTDIARDGTLAGTNLEVYSQINGIGIDIIASGGITFEREITALKAMGISGAILGKALYEGKLSLERALTLAK